MVREINRPPGDIFAIHRPEVPKGTSPESHSDYLCWAALLSQHFQTLSQFFETFKKNPDVVDTEFFYSGFGDKIVSIKSAINTLKMDKSLSDDEKNKLLKEIEPLMDLLNTPIVEGKSLMDIQDYHSRHLVQQILGELYKDKFDLFTKILTSCGNITHALQEHAQEIKRTDAGKHYAEIAVQDLKEIQKIMMQVRNGKIPPEKAGSLLYNAMETYKKHMNEALSSKEIEHTDQFSYILSIYGEFNVIADTLVFCQSTSMDASLLMLHNEKEAVDILKKFLEDGSSKSTLDYLFIDQISNVINRFKNY